MAAPNGRSLEPQAAAQPTLRAAASPAPVRQAEPGGSNQAQLRSLDDPGAAAGLGNQARTAGLTLSPAEAERMEQDRILLMKMLQLGDLSLFHERIAIDVVKRWVAKDEAWQEETGEESTPYLDKFLHMLRRQMVHYNEAPVLLEGQQALLYDLVWWETDQLAAEYQRLVGLSQEWGAPPTGRRNPEFWKEQGQLVSEYSGGVVRGLSVGGASAVDAGGWALTGVYNHHPITLANNWIHEQITGEKDALNLVAPNLTKEVEAGFDYMWPQLYGHKIDDGPQGLPGFSVGKSGNMAGNFAFNLALFKAGTLHKGWNTLYGITNAKSVDTAYHNMVAIIKRKKAEAEAKGQTFDPQSLASDGEFIMELANLFSNALGAATAGMGNFRMPTKLDLDVKRIAFLADGLAASGMLGRLCEIAASTTMTEEQRWQAFVPLMFDFLSKMVMTTMGAKSYLDDPGRQVLADEGRAFFPVKQAEGAAAPPEAQSPLAKQDPIVTEYEGFLQNRNLEASRAAQAEAAARAAVPKPKPAPPHGGERRTAWKRKRDRNRRVREEKARQEAAREAEAKRLKEQQIQEEQAKLARAAAIRAAAERDVEMRNISPRVEAQLQRSDAEVGRILAQGNQRIEELLQKPDPVTPHNGERRTAYKRRRKRNRREAAARQ